MANNEYIFGFQIHHIFPLKLFEGLIGDFLADMDITKEMKGNKIAVFKALSFARSF